MEYANYTTKYTESFSWHAVDRHTARPIVKGIYHTNWTMLGIEDGRVGKRLRILAGTCVDASAQISATVRRARWQFGTSRFVMVTGATARDKRLSGEVDTNWMVF